MLLAWRGWAFLFAGAFLVILAGARTPGLGSRGAPGRGPGDTTIPAASFAFSSVLARCP